MRLNAPDSAITERCLWTEDIPEDADGDLQEAILVRNRLIADDCKIRHDALVEWSEGVVAQFQEARAQ